MLISKMIQENIIDNNNNILIKMMIKLYVIKYIKYNS